MYIDQLPTLHTIPFLQQFGSSLFPVITGDTEVSEGFQARQNCCPNEGCKLTIWGCMDLTETICEQTMFS
jgi:hypothetical protein